MKNTCLKMNRAIISVFAALLLAAFPETDVMAQQARIPGDPAVFSRIDSMILSGTSPEEMADKASSLFDIFRESEIAGDENYAVYIAGKYFLNGNLPSDPNTETVMSLYCRLNGNSLAGMPAQELEMETPSLEDIRPGEVHSRHTILYFYDTECSRCLAEIPDLIGLSADRNIPGTDIYAIYTGNDLEKWYGFIENRLYGKGLDRQIPDGFNTDSIRFFNAADLTLSSGFHVAYGVIQTPLAVVIDSDGFILGRKIDLRTAGQMISDDIMYSNALNDYITSIYSTARPSGYEEACYFADRFIENTDGDDRLKRRTVRILFDKFAGSPDYEDIMASHYIAGKYIAGDSLLWKDDMRESAARLVRNASMNPVGDTISALTVYDVYGTPVDIRDNDGKYSVICFYSLDCPVCGLAGETIERLKEKYPGIRFLEIYTGTEFYRWAEANFHKESGLQLQDCEMKSGMYTKFNLESVPAIYITDPDNIVVAKEIGPATLSSVLAEIDRYISPR